MYTTLGTTLFLSRAPPLYSIERLSLNLNYNKMLKRRTRGVYEIGNVVYIMSHVAYQQSKDFDL